MLKSSITLTGRLLIQKFEADGTLVYSTEVPNLVVTSGKEFIASRLISDDYLVIDYMSIGDNSTVGAISQTALINELGRVQLSSATANGTATTFTALFPAGTATGSIVEAGLFNADSNAMLTFDGATAVASNIITINSHGLETGDKVTYNNGGGSSIGGLTSGSSYYVVNTGTNTFKLALTYAYAINVSPTTITLTDGSGSNHKIISGMMLARTTFPVITKSASQSLSISWVVSVG